MNHTELDVMVVIIGAGPAGLAAACACKDCGLSAVVLDSRGLAQSFHEYPHGLRFFSPPDEMEIGRVPLPVAGGEKPTREQYLAYLRAVVRSRDLHLSTWESVRSLSVAENQTYKLQTAFEPGAGDGRTIGAKAIIVATGVWGAPVKMDIAGFERPNVYTEFVEPTPFTGQPVLVIGGGNSAYGAALSLMEARAHVTVSVRRPPKDYRCGVRPFVKRDLDFAVDEGKINLHAGTIVTRINPFSAVLQPVVYTGTEDLTEGGQEDYQEQGDPYEVPCRFVFSMLGHKPDVAFLRDVMQLELRENGRPVANPTTWETTRQNIFVAGSLADPSIDIVLHLRNQARAVVAEIALLS